MLSSRKRRLSTDKIVFSQYNSFSSSTNPKQAVVVQSNKTDSNWDVVRQVIGYVEGRLLKLKFAEDVLQTIDQNYSGANSKDHKFSKKTVFEQLDDYLFFVVRVIPCFPVCILEAHFSTDYGNSLGRYYLSNFFCNR